MQVDMCTALPLDKAETGEITARLEACQSYLHKEVTLRPASTASAHPASH